MIRPKYHLVLVAVLYFLCSQLQAQQLFASLEEALFSGGKLVGNTGPENVSWIDEGDRFSFLETTENGQTIRSYDPKTEKQSVVFSDQGVTFPGTDQPFEFSSFQWTKDSRYILFQTNFRPVWRKSGISDFYYYSVSDKSMKLVAKDAQTAEVSPDGTKVGYERGGNLFVFDFASQSERQLTSDAKEYFYNGRFGWAYEEEFGLAQAWIWSPDSKYIAFWQSDERAVPIFRMTDYSGQHSQYVKVPYPKVGDTNPTVKIGVIDLENQENTWMKLDLAGGYVPRLYWTSVEGQLAVVHLNRKQNHLKLFFFDATSGQGKIMMEESSKTWIDVFDFFAGIMHLFFFPEDKKEFLWISDRDGWSHIYRYDYQGNLLGQVTKGSWEVTRVEAVDAGSNTIYYSSTEETPLERHLYAIDFKGKNKRKLTREPGRHRLEVAPNGKYFIDRYSSVDNPAKVQLWTPKGKLLKTFTENEGVKQFIEDYYYAKKELFSFTTSDGQELDGYLIKPPDFDPGKSYPLVLNIYGGPGAQSVYNQFATNSWEQYLAQQGYVVASVNNRGSGGYGSEFEKIVYKNLGYWESKDFVETAQYLAGQPWIDGSNMAIRGHSYGGYMSSYTMLNHPGIFKVALVGAPVTDWRLYDSIYTERYMGLIDENEEGYNRSSPTTAAAKLEGHMFIAHSAMDENVHLKNTMQLVKALIDHGKDHDLRIYPPGNHGVAYHGTSYVLLYSQYVDYLDRHLKGELGVLLPDNKK